MTLPIGAYYVDAQFFQSRIWAVGLMVAVLSSALPYSLDMMALKHLSAKTFGILMSLEPAFAALMGLLFLHETLNVQQSLAMVCVIAASLGCTLSSPEAKSHVLDPENGF
ncbi:MAG TPA: EamA family transporter [Oligoflexus sp.]|uniref:EamA family transporter n=1 Tax=Oligoflexus sp. TaxID=1971216 RepID=UPI002D594644|nr:EamA family transporter [Oligoflexus sp.]HYX32238.1 EamA family transporter [Oligoflexus sp.]